MNLLADLHWLRPGWLLLLPLLPLLLWLRPDARREGAWSAHCDPTLFNYLAVPDGTRNRRWPLALLVIGWLLGVLALAGPSWELAATQVYRSGASRVIVLDLSRSMDATDVTPSRLVRARFKAADLLARAADGRVGLVVFAGDAFALAPVTEDVATLLNLLSPLETALMPVQGSRADRGITRAVELLAGAGAGNGDIVLIADGAPPSAVDAARDALAAGYRVAVLAVGTRAGAPIPDSDGGFVKDNQGNIVVPTVDTGRLLDIAQAGGGRYATLAVDDSDIDRLMRPFEAGLADTQGEEWNRQSQAWLDRGPWLLLALLPLAALGFRRGWLTGLAAVALLVPPSPASALSWADLWQRPEQQVREALADGDTERALQAAPEAPPRLARQRAVSGR